MKPYFLNSFIFMASWIVGYVASLYLMNGLSAVENYAIINGWWFAAFVYSKFKLNVYSILPSALVYGLVFLLFAMLDSNLLYKDAGGLGGISLVTISLVQSAIFISPSLFSSLFEFVTGKVAKI